MATRPSNRILLVGWDAADWEMIRPLVAQGRMPTLARLIEGGVSGNLATIQPILSPMLWTSIATGTRADKHGIGGFVEPKPDRSGIRPVSSTSRTCKALWNVLTQCGMTSHVVSWFASHPAEPIRGSVVTNRFSATRPKPAEPTQFPPGTFHPAALEDQLANLAVSPWDLESDALLPFVPRAAEIDQETDDRLVKLADLIARTSTVHAAACRLVAQDDWDLAAVYYSAIDEFGHFFMPYHPPCLAGVDPHDADVYRDVMTGCYRFHDMMLEALLAYAGPETTVLLVSDHGFLSDSRRPGPNAWERPEAWHREFGIACLQGPGVRTGESLFGATLLDVTPTILALLGLPVGRDMDGRPWLEALDTPTPLKWIPSWEEVAGDAGLHSAEFREDPADAAEAMRTLIDLGYVEPPGDDVEEAIRKVARDRKINLATALTSSHRAAGALPLWQELAAEYPAEVGFQIQLASCYLRMGSAEPCRRTIEQIEGAMRESPYVQLMLAGVAQLEGRVADALGIAREVFDQAPSNELVLNRVGEIFVQTESWQEAQSAFHQALALRGENPVARDGLARVFLARDDYQSALEQSLLAVGLMHFFPAAHFHLGEALHGLGRETEAIAAFETSLSMGYQPAETHSRLAALYRFRNPLQARRHQELSVADNW
jgi:predicted AlkP superfamily phosphohydrolase/phosphomutase/tetratricopeptide (TPR) repeat protein